MSMIEDNIRCLFPALQQKVYGKDWVYFDNAATSQKPQDVLDLQQLMSGRVNANIHRAMHKISGDATDLYEQGRAAVARFINAPEDGCVIFTSGATASFNLLAHSFVERFISTGDKILISEAEHHSNIVPWQLACARAGAELVVLPVEENGTLDLTRFEKMLDSKVKLVSVAQISNVLGVINPVKEIVEIAHSKGIPVAVDGAQGVVHADADVQKLGCDFYIFSGHKIYAPTGTGVLYGKRKLLEEMPPYMGGGDMVDTVTFAKTTYAPLPLKFEAGTPNYVAASCYAPALKFAQQMRDNAEVAENEKKITAFLVEQLQAIDGLHLYGLPEDLGQKAPVFSFTVDGTHPSDIAQIIDKMGVAVRSGLMCAEPLIRRFSDVGMVRASILPYNTLAEAEYFISSLKRTINMLK